MSFLIEQYDNLANALILASKNIVSPNLLAPSELQKLLHKAKEQYKFKLLYDDDDNINKYYHILSLSLYSITRNPIF